MIKVLAIVITGAALSFAPMAHADPDPICQQSTQFGLSPGQIADNLHSGQPNMPEFRQRGTVINHLGECP
jgi:hypothetical protein